MDWQKGMNQAIDYIEEHLTGDIDLNVAARFVSCSVWEFQRIFSFLTHISPGEYIRQRRLTLAAGDIQKTDEKIIDIAQKYGYDSPAAFSRAFGQLHGITPSAARGGGVTLNTYPRITFETYEKRTGVIYMTGVEIDMVITDSRKALELYESIFDVERVEVTDFPVGLNEVIFNLYGTRFHLLDENPEYQLTAPKPGDPKPSWYTVLVPSVQDIHSKAMAAGCTEVQAVTDLPDYGVSNSLFADPFGYIWMLQQINKEVSFEERNRLWEEKLKNE